MYLTINKYSIYFIIKSVITPIKTDYKNVIYEKFSRFSACEAYKYLTLERNNIPKKSVIFKKNVLLHSSAGEMVEYTSKAFFAFILKTKSPNFKTVEG